MAGFFGAGGHTFTETYDQHQKNVAKLRTMEKAIQNDTVEPPDDPAPAAAAAPANPADTNPTASATKPAAPAKRTRNTPAPARQGAVQPSPPVVQR